MSALDPYEELGVPRNADRAAVRAGYRRRAKKTHPDAKSGSADAFKRTRTALSVLLDPARRERFDNTGSIEDDKPDNLRSAALQVIEMQLGKIINPFLASGMQDQAADPRHRDVLKEVRASIAAEIERGREGVKVGAQVVEFCRDMAARYAEPEGDALLRRSSEEAERRQQQQIDNVLEQIKAHEKALELLDGRGFRFDPAATVGAPVGVGIRVFRVNPLTGTMDEVNPADWGGQ